ncbi:MAG: hypothetical protein ACJAX4_000032 [Clostridium sp.]|jgi:hypothetical protein
MTEKDGRIFITSVGKASKHLEYYGKANLEGLSLLRLIYKYSCYSTTYSTLQRLNSMVTTLQLTDPFICIEKQALPSFISDFEPIGIVEIKTSGVVLPNVAPTISSFSISLGDAANNYNFSNLTSLSSYSDPEGTNQSSFVVKSLPSTGTLFYNGSEVQLNSLLLNPELLVYTREGTVGYSTSFTISAYDNDLQVPLESNIATISVEVVQIAVENEPATVGDTKLYGNNRVTTVFSSADFTTKAIAPYSDPEGDALDAIKILDISSINNGTYYYFGAIAIIGQVITKSELDSGAFYHESADSNAITTDTISVAVRDTGSMEWVE